MHGPRNCMFRSTGPCMLRHFHFDTFQLPKMRSSFGPVWGLHSIEEHYRVCPTRNSSKPKVLEDRRQKRFVWGLGRSPLTYVESYCKKLFKNIKYPFWGFSPEVSCRSTDGTTSPGACLLRHSIHPGRRRQKRGDLQPSRPGSSPNDGLGFLG